MRLVNRICCWLGLHWWLDIRFTSSSVLGDNALCRDCGRLQIQPVLAPLDPRYELAQVMVPPSRYVFRAKLPAWAELALRKPDDAG